MSEYAKACWEDLLGTKILATIDSKDWSADYQVDAAHLLQLENGKFAVVTERGCSCYSYDDAGIEVYITLEEAKIEYEKATRNTD